MGNQPPTPSGRPTRTKYEDMTYAIAFAVLFLEAFVLITSPVWESNAPQWVPPILGKKGELLGVAAAAWLLLSLLLGLNPGGWTMLATIFSGVLGFAAAVFSLALESADDISVGLALLCLVFPLFIIMLPALRFPQKWLDWLGLLWATLFMFIVILSIILGVKPVTQWVIKAGFLGSGNILIVPMVLSVLIIAVIIVVQLAIEAAVQKIAGFAWTRKVRLQIHRRRQRQSPRSKRRRSGERNR